MAVRRWIARAAAGAALLAAFAAGCASGPPGQPHMQNALDSLQTAQSELQLAAPNKGGHRERAMALVSEAMSQVDLGIRFADGGGP